MTCPRPPSVSAVRSLRFFPTFSLQLFTLCYCLRVVYLRTSDILTESNCKSSKYYKTIKIQQTFNLFYHESPNDIILVLRFTVSYSCYYFETKPSMKNLIYEYYSKFLKDVNTSKSKIKILQCKNLDLLATLIFPVSLVLKLFCKSIQHSPINEAPLINVS